MHPDRHTLVIDTAEQVFTVRSRRDFLRALATGGSVILLPGVFAACGDDEDSVTAPGVSAATLDLSSDVGIINYLYVIEQFTADFYVRVIQEANAAGFNAIQRRFLQDVRNHEFIHTETLRALLGAGRVPEIRIDRRFGGTDFRSRQSILEKAVEIEDLTVSAYNNAGQYMSTAANLILAAKIASVEGRHSAVVRDLLDDVTSDSGLLFAGDDIVDENGLDNKGQPTTPAAVIAAADPFIDARITITNPPA